MYFLYLSSTSVWHSSITSVVEYTVFSPKSKMAEPLCLPVSPKLAHNAKHINHPFFLKLAAPDRRGNETPSPANPGTADTEQCEQR